MKPVMKTLLKTLCIYHGGCTDGFAAAWAVRAALGAAVEFYPGVHQQAPPDVAGRDVVLVDFSYKRPVLDRMAETARSIVVLDHHISAAEDLAGYPEPPPRSPSSPSSRPSRPSPPSDSTDQPPPQTWALFDMQRSGAGIAWDFYHDAPRPKLIDHIEDGDLWRFKLDGTREIHAAVSSYPHDFSVWDRLMAMPPDQLKGEGAVLERKQAKDIDDLLPETQRRMIIDGHNVPVANLPGTMSSDAGHRMAQGEPFAACYMDGPQGRSFSLRSSDDGEDVAAIAKKFGGGGHKQAAGFRVSFTKAAAFEIKD